MCTLLLSEKTRADKIIDKWRWKRERENESLIYVSHILTLISILLSTLFLPRRDQKSIKICYFRVSLIHYKSGSFVSLSVLFFGHVLFRETIMQAPLWFFLIFQKDSFRIEGKTFLRTLDFGFDMGSSSICVFEKC